MNNLKRIFKDTILGADLLSSEVSLRFGGSTVYASFFPAAISIITVSLFLVIFVLKFMSISNLQNITASQHLVDNLDSSQPLNNIMFAMTIEGMDMKSIDRYFEFTVTQVTLSRTQGSSDPKVRTEREILLLPCKIDYWLYMGIESMSTIFEKRGMSAYYCPTKSFVIQGTSDEDTYIFAEIRLKKCNSSAPFCEKNETLREAFYPQYVQKNQYFTVKLFLKDSLITPTSVVTVSNYLERDIFLQFSTTTGTVGYIKFADFQVTTDISIMPWTQYVTRTGYYIQKSQTSTVPSSTRFLYLKLQKSTKKFTVQRQYGKIDDLLSYIGGLFGLLFYCIEFFMSAYNQYRYELAIGETLFNYSQSGQQSKQEDMNFFTYVQYSLYSWLAVFNLNPKKWKEMKAIDQTREQVNQQLDIRYLMNRMRYLQTVIEVLVTDEQRMCLMLAQLPTLQKIQKFRKVTEFFMEHKNQKQNIDDKQSSEDKSETQKKYFDISHHQRVMARNQQINNNNNDKSNFDINLSEKLRQLTEMAMGLVKSKQQQSKGSINCQNKISGNMKRCQNEHPLNLISLSSNNKLNSANQIQGHMMSQNQIPQNINENSIHIQANINFQPQKQKQQDQQDLMLQLGQALIQVAGNPQNPINRKIINFLKPQLIIKILNLSLKNLQSSANIPQQQENNSNSSMFIQLKRKSNDISNSYHSQK